MKNSGGDLRIRGDVLKLAREDGSEFYLVANVNNEVTLYFNGDGKLATTNTGIDVTGDVQCSDNVIVANNVKHHGDLDTYIEFTDDKIRLLAGGKGILTVTESTIDSVVINDGGNNCDTRIEGLNDENLLFVDGSTDRVGIGTDTPTALFHVDGDAKVGSSQSAGVILTSPNGTEYRLIVADNGTLSTSSV